MQDFVRIIRKVRSVFETKQIQWIVFWRRGERCFWCLATLHVLSPAGNGMAPFIFRLGNQSLIEKK